MDMILMITVRAGAEHSRKPIADSGLHGDPKLRRRSGIGRPHHAAILESDRANVERVGKTVLAQLGAGDAISAAAVVRVEVFDSAQGGAQSGSGRRQGLTPETTYALRH